MESESEIETCQPPHFLRGYDKSWSAGPRRLRDRRSRRPTTQPRHIPTSGNLPYYYYKVYLLYMYRHFSRRRHLYSRRGQARVKLSFNIVAAYLTTNPRYPKVLS